jgi:hypothetical protein
VTLIVWNRFWRVGLCSANPKPVGLEKLTPKLRQDRAKPFVLRLADAGVMQ